MIWTLNPLWLYVALVGAFLVVLIHTVASRFAPKVVFSWVGFFTSEATRTSFLLRVRDYLVLLVRTLIIFLLFLLLSKPFLYKGKPPREIWVKDVSVEDVRKILKDWGEFAVIRFSPSRNPRGKVALVGSWNEVPPVEYEVWSESFGWEVLTLRVDRSRLAMKIKNTGKKTNIKIRIKSAKLSLSDNITLPPETTVEYSVSGDFEKETIIEVGPLRIYEYVAGEKHKGRVAGKGMDREVVEAALDVSGSEVSVGIDTLKGKVLFVRRCKILENLGLKYRTGTVRFALSDTGCIFSMGEPILYDKNGNLVGVKFKDRYIFGFSPAYTGFGFTPEFLRLISIFSEKLWKLYASVGDSVRFGESVRIKGKTSLCCPRVFVPRVAGIYKIYKNESLVGVVVVNERVKVKIPPPPKPLNTYIRLLILTLLLLEIGMVIIFGRF